MKYILALFLTFIIFLSFAQDSFCEGWDVGFKNALSDNNKLEAITTICPIPGINQNTYQAGYNLGYKKALKKIGKNEGNIIHEKGEKISFCEGWEEGYENALSDNNKFKRIVPICPIPGLNQDTYQVGYNLGYKKALEKMEMNEENIIHKNGKKISFCDGWEEGYENTLKENNKFVGIIPICPIPSINEDNYNSGYKKGVIEALKKINK